MISRVLFDVGNVILRSTHKITEAILWELGVRPDKVAFFFHQTAYGEFARGKISGEEFAEATREALDAPWLTDDQIQVAHDSQIYMVDEAVIEIVRELYLNKRLLGFVTTTNKWQTERERELIDLESEFGRVVRSHEIGMTKADPASWPVILRQFNLAPAEAATVLLVDDAKENNRAAKAAGLTTHLYDPAPIAGVGKLRVALSEYRLLV